MLIAKFLNFFRSPLYAFFIAKNFITGEEDDSPQIKIPSDFSFYSNYDVAINVLRQFIAAIFIRGAKEITLDFSKCTNVDQAALFVLQILRLDFQNEFEKLDKRLAVLSTKLIVKPIKSENANVNKLLFVTGILSQVDLKLEGLMPMTTTGYYKGIKTQKHYTENRKGIIGTRIVAYINDCLARHSYSFNADGVNYLDGLISEVLNNAEDHSPFNILLCYC